MCPAFSIGNSKRDDLFILKGLYDSPGPTKYSNLTNDFNKNANKNKHSKKKDLFPILLNCDSLILSDSFTIRNKKIQKKNRSASKRYRQKPTSGFGSSQLKVSSYIKRETSPGPGYYNPNELAYKEKATRCIFPRSGLKTSIASRNPKDGFRPQFQDKNKHIPESPGPAKYNNNEIPVRKLNIQYSFNKANKFLKEKNETPGPSFYNVSYSQIQSHSPHVSLMGRKYPQKQEILPGPGRYEEMRVFEVKNSKERSFSTSSRTEEWALKKPHLYPGPADYKACSYRNSNPGSFTHSSRISSKNNEQSPGPAKYNYKTFLGESPKYTLNKSQRTNIPKDSPGPTTYCMTQSSFDRNHPSSFKKAPKVSLNLNTQFQNPGPAQYNLISKLKAIGGAFNQTPKDYENREPSPGPGSYENAQFFGTLPSYYNIKKK